MKKYLFLFAYLFTQIIYSNNLQNFILVNPSSINIDGKHIAVRLKGEITFKHLEINIPRHDAVEIPISKNKEIVEVKINNIIVKEEWTSVTTGVDSYSARINMNNTKDFIYRLDFCDDKAKYIKKLIISNWTNNSKLKLTAIKYIDEPFIRFHIKPIEIKDNESSLIPIDIIYSNGIYSGRELEVEYCGFSHNNPCINFMLPKKDKYDCNSINLLRIKSGQFAVGVELSSGNPPQCKKKNFYLY